MVDTTTIHHVTLCKEFFSSYTSGDFGVLKTSNDVELQVVVTRDVYLKSNNRVQFILKDVKHALDICLNLISVESLMMRDTAMILEEVHGNLSEALWFWIEERNVQIYIEHRLRSPKL